VRSLCQPYTQRICARNFDSETVDWALTRCNEADLVRSNLSFVKDEVVEGGHVVLGTVLGLELPGPVILGVLPTAVVLVDLALRLGFYLRQSTQTGHFTDKS